MWRSGFVKLPETPSVPICPPNPSLKNFLGNKKDQVFTWSKNLLLCLTNNVYYIIIYYRNESCRWCLQTPIRRFNSRDIDCFETTAIFGEMGGCFFFISKKKFYLSVLDKVIIPMITNKSVNTSMVDIGHHLP